MSVLLDTYQKLQAEKAVSEGRREALEQVGLERREAWQRAEQAEADLAWHKLRVQGLLHAATEEVERRREVERKQLEAAWDAQAWQRLYYEARELNGRYEEELASHNKVTVLDDIGWWLAQNMAWSKQTFGEGRRTLGILQHIRKELAEIEAKPDDLSEWIDVIILATDGYWRHGGTPDSLLADLTAKQRKNFARRWPKPVSEDVAVEHVKTQDDLIEEVSDQLARRAAEGFSL